MEPSKPKSRDDSRSLKKSCVDEVQMRRAINRILKRYGYEIVKTDRFYSCLMEEYARTEDFCFVQIGANDGMKFDRLYEFVTSRKCRGLVVELLTFCFEALKKNYSRYPNIIPVNCGVHSTKKRAALYYVDPERLGSLPEWSQGIGSMNPDHHKKSNTPSDCIVSEEVECVHLMDLFRQNKIDHINLLQIDVEGYDLEVIRMIDFDEVRPALVKFEHSNLSVEERARAKEIFVSNGYAVFSQGNDSVARLVPSP